MTDWVDWVDTRELIVVRLMEVLATVPGTTNVYRDRGEVGDTTLLPAAVVLDGREYLPDIEYLLNMKTPRMPRVAFRFEPEVFVVLRPRTNVGNTQKPDGTEVPIGPEISAFRAGVIANVINDPTLLGYCSPWPVVFAGLETDMQTGTLMEGHIQFRFVFPYLFTPPTQ